MDLKHIRAKGILIKIIADEVSIRNDELAVNELINKATPVTPPAKRLLGSIKTRIEKADRNADTIHAIIEIVFLYFRIPFTLTPPLFYYSIPK